MFHRNLSDVFSLIEAHGHCELKFEERGERICVFVRCWNKSQFRRLCAAILSRFSNKVKQEVSKSVTLLDPMFLGGHRTVVHMRLLRRMCRIPQNGYHHKLMENPFFDLRLFESWLQQTASSVFGSLDQLLLFDGVYCQQTGRNRKLWLDGFLSHFEEGHHHK